MRLILIVALFALSACDKKSSPEGRMKIKTEELQAAVDSLKGQNKAILDSIVSIRQELRAMRNETD